MIDKLKLLVESYKVRPPHSNVLVSEIITLFEQFTNETTPQKLVNVDQRVMLNFVDIKELFLMEIEKHDNIRMGAMLAKDIQAERTARENKKAIVDLFGKVKSKISA